MHPGQSTRTCLKSSKNLKRKTAKNQTQTKRKPQQEINQPPKNPKQNNQTNFKKPQKTQQAKNMSYKESLHLLEYTQIVYLTFTLDGKTIPKHQISQQEKSQVDSRNYFPNFL